MQLQYLWGMLVENMDYRNGILSFYEDAPTIGFAIHNDFCRELLLLDQYCF